MDNETFVGADARQIKEMKAESERVSEAVVKSEPSNIMRSNYSPTITIRKSNQMKGGLLFLQAHINVIICRKKLEWFISIDGGILDVTPTQSSFLNINFNSYEVSDQILKLEPGLNGTYDLFAVADVLICEFLSQQKQNIAALTHNGNGNTLFTLELLDAIPNVSQILLTDAESLKIICEFPLFSGNENQNPSYMYLYDTTIGDPIIISLLLTQTGNNFALDYRVMFPKTMPCSRNIEFPTRFNGASNNDMSLIDFLPYVEGKILSSLSYRKSFLEELLRLTAVLEYDAIDFSFVLIAVRMKHNNMYTICTVEFRLTHSFPSTLPLLSLHDLQDAFSAPIDTSSLKPNKSWSPERFARELLLLSCSVISHQAFGTNILHM